MHAVDRNIFRSSIILVPLAFGALRFLVFAVLQHWLPQLHADGIQGRNILRHILHRLLELQIAQFISDRLKLLNQSLRLALAGVPPNLLHHALKVLNSKSKARHVS